eukprot:579227_1
MTSVFRRSMCTSAFYLLVYVVVLETSYAYFLDKHDNCNNVKQAVSIPENSTKYVEYLGTFSNTNDCIQACLDHSTTGIQCESYTYYTPQYNVQSYASHCYGRFGKPYGLLWTPMTEDNVYCGRVIYPCVSDIDCEFNGKCDTITNICTCNKGWSGYHCQTLNLQKATEGTGYHILNDNNSGKPTSSWGGSVFVDKSDTNNDTKYHMFLAEFDRHCGVHSWTLNSVVTHAQSTKGWNSPYQRVEVLHSHFAHEPNSATGPDGELIIYYSAFNFSGVEECECSDGSTPPSCKTPPNRFINLMDWSPSGSPNGPWNRTVIFPTKPTTQGDTNLAGVITQNGTFIGLMRYWIKTGSQIHLVTSMDWKDGSKYLISELLLFPQLISGYTEDPFVYVDCNGHYHAIFHNMSPGGQALCGGHAYSANGIDWIYAGSSYGNHVEFTNGANFTFSRRERPHLIFDEDGCTPIALTNGAQYGGEYHDATYTLCNLLHIELK